MAPRNVHDLRNPLAGISRRQLLKGAGIVAAAHSARTQALANEPTLAYVGTYTNHGEGIYLVSINPSNGHLTQVKVFTGISNPSWLAFHPNKKYLYAGNEDSPGMVSAFAIESNGDLTFLNMVSSQGSGPAHLSVHRSGRWVLVANYGSGNVAVLPILGDGSLGDASEIKNDADVCTPGPCPLGPANATEAPPGSFAISGHDAPHAHMIECDPGGDYAIVNDLGLDLTIVWKFNAVSGMLSNPKTTPSSPGAGPRHFAFHPNGRWFYSLNEESSTLAFMTYEDNDGSLHPVKEISTLPANFTGTNFTSEVIISQDGKHAYAANRLHDTVAIFRIHMDGEPELLREKSTRGDYPRNIAIDPTGQFLYSCNQRSDAITSFRLVNGGSDLRFTGQYLPVGSPAIIIFL